MAVTEDYNRGKASDFDVEDAFGGFLNIVILKHRFLFVK